MRRTALSRRSPLKRKARLRPRRATPRRSGREYDDLYLEAVRRLPCVLWTEGNCDAWYVKGELLRQADHAGERPLGRKADDSTAIPMCPRHHRSRTDYTGFFRGWSGAMMRLWCDIAIAETRARLGRAA
jgi:hypothetical protein